MDPWFLGFTDTWFLGFKLSWFLGFGISKTNVHVMFLIDIDLIFKIFKMLLNGSSGFFSARFSNIDEVVDFQTKQRFLKITCKCSRGVLDLF